MLSKTKCLALTALIAAAPLAMATHAKMNDMRFGIGAAAVGPAISPSFFVNSPRFEAGIDGNILNVSESTTMTLAFWGGMRREFHPHMYWSLGGEFVTRLGNVYTHFYTISPYIGMDVLPPFSKHLLIGAWLNPVSWNSARNAGTTTNTWSFGSGGLNVAYLF
jgi:hypothetical protein